jgi:Contractile injection system tube protein
MSIANLLTGSSLEAQYNPTEFEEEISVNWNKLPVLGHSHEPLQYKNTGNHTFSFDLAWSALNDRGITVDDLDLARRFMLSSCYSSRKAAVVQAAEPTDLLFLWPTMIAIVAKMPTLKIKHTDFNAAGKTVRMVMNIKLEEARRVRLYAEDVLERGTIRSNTRAGA